MMAYGMATIALTSATKRNVVLCSERSPCPKGTQTSTTSRHSKCGPCIFKTTHNSSRPTIFSFHPPHLGSHSRPERVLQVLCLVNLRIYSSNPALFLGFQESMFQCFTTRNQISI